MSTAFRSFCCLCRQNNLEKFIETQYAEGSRLCAITPFKWTKMVDGSVEVEVFQLVFERPAGNQP